MVKKISTSNTARIAIVAIVSRLGVETTSFAALLASAGVAIGMALSGNLSNFAGGLIIPIKRHIQLMGKVIFLILLSAGICQITTKHLMPPYYSFTEWIYNSILLFVYSILVFFILFAVFCKEFRNLFYRFLIITRHKT